MIRSVLSKKNRALFLAITSTLYLLMMFIIWNINILDILIINTPIYKYANMIFVFAVLINLDRVIEEKRIKSITILILIMFFLLYNSYHVEFGIRAREYIYAIIPLFMVYMIAYQHERKFILKYGLFALLMLFNIYNILGVIGAIVRFDTFFNFIPNRLIDNYRYSSILTNPNAWGEFAFISLWIATLYMMQSNDTKKRLMYLGFMGLSVLALVASMSRSAILMSVILYAVLLVFSKKLNPAICRLVRVGALLVMAGVVTLFIIDFDFAVSLFRLNQGLTERDQIWAYLIEQIKENRWYGAGYGNGTMIITFTDDFSVSSPHNLYLALLFEMGIIPFVLIMVYFIHRIVRNFRFMSYTKKHDMTLMWISGFFMAFLVGQFFEYSFFTIGPMNTFVFVLFAISIGLIKDIKKEGIYRIKVTHMITGLDNGGAESMLYKILKHGDQSKYVFKVISLTHEGFYGEKLKALGIEVVPLKLQDKRHLPKAIYLLIKQVSNTEVLQTWLYHANFLGTIVGRLLWVETIIWGVRQADISLEHNKPFTIKIARYSRYIAFMATKILSNSDEVTEAHIALGYPKKKFITIYNGFELSLFKYNENSRTSIRKDLQIDNEIVFIQVARYDIQKDHQTAFKAFELFKNELGKPFSIVFCGMGMDPSNTSLVKQLEDHGLLAQSRLLGIRSDIPDLLSAADFFLLSSLGEGFPNVLGEAMSAKIIPIVTNAGDCKMIVGDAGFVVRKQNPKALGQAMVEAYRMSEDDKTAMRMRGRKRIEVNFDIIEITKQYESLYR